MGRKKRKQRLSSGSSSDQSFTQTPYKKQSTVLGYFSKITENTESNSANMEHEIKDKEQTDSKSVNSDLDIESMSDRDMLKLIVCDIRDIKASIKYQDTEIYELKQKVCALEQKTQQQQEDISAMTAKIQQIEQRELEAECYTKRMNLIMRNVPCSENENLDTKMRSIFQNTMQIEPTNIVFDTIHRLKKDNNAVIMRFTRFDDRQRIWRARSNLRGTDFRLHEHFPREIENNRRNILPVYIRAKQMEKESTSIYRDQITFKGAKYTIDNIDSLTEQIGMTDLNSRYNDKVYLWQDVAFIKLPQ